MKKERWVVSAKRADFQAIADRFGIDPVIARLIRNRDVTGEKEIEEYLFGDLEQLHDPLLMKDMERAADLIAEKIREKKPIRIIGDYDIDGVTATYILLTGLKDLGADADVRIPDRIADGYGLNEHLVQFAADEGRDTIVTCDNGIAAGSQIRLAKELGMTVIVTDHHEVVTRFRLRRMKTENAATSCRRRTRLSIRNRKTVPIRFRASAVRPSHGN